MVCSHGAGLGLDEVVVEHMRREHGDADRDDSAFAGWSAPVATG
jgi:hypothetical protein